MARSAINNAPGSTFEVVGPWGSLRIETASGAVLTYGPEECAADFDDIRTVDVKRLRKQFANRSLCVFDIAECGYWDSDDVYHPPVSA